MEKYKEIEKSIITKYRKTIWSKFIKGIKDYQLINENDNIMVCISGGKDSFLMAKCIEELSRHGKIKFTAKFVVMDPGYNKESKKKILENAKILNIDIEVFDTPIFEIVDSLGKDSFSCYLCARMRRGHLYNRAQELGCNKIALGHHFDDVIETTLLSMMYGAEIKTMLPKLHSKNFEGVELIRPMYLIKEESIIAWSKGNDLDFLNCACKFTETANIDEDISKRLEMKNLIDDLRKINPSVDLNIFKSISNVNMDGILGYRKDGVLKTFLDEYDNIKSNDE